MVDWLRPFSSAAAAAEGCCWFLLLSLLLLMLSFVSRRLPPLSLLSRPMSRSLVDDWPQLTLLLLGPLLLSLPPLSSLKLSLLLLSELSLIRRSRGRQATIAAANLTPQPQLEAASSAPKLAARRKTAHESSKGDATRAARNGLVYAAHCPRRAMLLSTKHVPRSSNWS